MPDEFEGDLAGAVFWGADLSGARFRDVDLTGATITHAWLAGVEIDAFVDRLIVNGVDVTAYVNEHDPWYPLRAMLRPVDAAAMRATWSALEREWTITVEQAHSVRDDALHRRVDDQWSFVETTRHLVFAIDKWFTAPVLGAGFDPIGLPNTGSLDFPWPDLDLECTPSVVEALAVLSDRSTRVGAFIDSMHDVDLDAPIEVLENCTNPLRECLFTVFEEAFWHIRYSRRDLAALGAAP
ncbi:MAG TPA: DinB family protein [Acidimicrobiia bacterium]|jgi:hypothetical protein